MLLVQMDGSELDTEVVLYHVDHNMDKMLINYVSSKFEEAEGLITVMSTKAKRKLISWVLNLQSLKFTIEHVTGEAN
ncbi:hypothetical protein PR048_013999 [Dryococelus australis]|uniref:Uncharacterized protein n=1 Tax=Dryococelus australis TaxID=614101 RepID=A0ABQ9HUN5_9NEOP|nr:hypothetical protein PR048_013999 [Dryococelus australis]